MEVDDVRSLAIRFVSYLETGDAPEGLFRPDVFCDFTPPQWRIQAQGIEDVLGARKWSHPSPGRVPRYRIDPIPTGFVIELEERWEQGGERWYCREMFRADVVDGAISEISIYCTGDWDEELQDRHVREVSLLRP